MCKHGRAPCYVFCGVERHPFFGWMAIKPEERARWFGRFFGLLFRQRERDKLGGRS